MPVHAPGDDQSPRSDESAPSEQDTPHEPDENAEGVELTMSEEPNSFEPEEDPDASAPDLVSSD